MAPLPQMPPAFDFSDIAFVFVVLILVGAFCWQVRSALRASAKEWLKAMKSAVKESVKEALKELKDEDRDTGKGKDK